MHFLDRLIESFLTEDVALTKGSQRVMNDGKLVADLADSMRDDARSHPQNFPPGSARSFQKAPDKDLAKWFLENLDRIEKEGYEGTVYSRDGVNSEWIVRRYIAGSHNWEDLTGVMNMNLRDWYLLKNRNILEPNHRDIPKFNSVRDIGFYMTSHYRDELEKARDAAKNAARNKMSKSVKLIDNDQYRIYTTLNRAAACALGLGTQWCTANSNYGGHFHNYADKAMLFQLFPYTGEKDEDGKKVIKQGESYQFDAGGPNFMNIVDRPPDPEVIRTNYPYIYSDLVHALTQNKSKLEKSFKELADDPTLQGSDFKIKSYDIDQEINKLSKLKDRGYFTDLERPSKKEEPAAQPPEQSSPTALPSPEQPIQEDETTGQTLNRYFGKFADRAERNIEKQKYNIQSGNSSNDYDSSYHSYFRSNIKLNPAYKAHCDKIVSSLEKVPGLTALKIKDYVEKYFNHAGNKADEKTLRLMIAGVIKELEAKGLKFSDKNSLKEQLQPIVNFLLRDEDDTDITVTKINRQKISESKNSITKNKTNKTNKADQDVLDLFRRLNNFGKR